MFRHKPAAAVRGQTRARLSFRTRLLRTSQQGAQRGLPRCSTRRSGQEESHFSAVQEQCCSLKSALPIMSGFSSGQRQRTLRSVYFCAFVATACAACYNSPDSTLNRFVRRILDSVHAGLITGAIYWYCVTSFTDLLAIQRPIWYVRMAED